MIQINAVHKKHSNDLSAQATLFLKKVELN